MKAIIFSVLMTSCSSGYAHSDPPLHLNDVDLATAGLALLMLAVFLATAWSSKIQKRVRIEEQQKTADVFDERFESEAKTRSNR